jgi:hypothetical protein
MIEREDDRRRDERGGRIERRMREREDELRSECDLKGKGGRGKGGGRK